MSIRPITRDQFNKKNPQRAPTVALIADERAWFADDSGNIVGAILFDKSDKDWNYVILGPDERGDFRWIAGDSSFKTRELAVEKLLDAMKVIAEKDEK